MSDISKRKFYLTTPIYYVNARPHIGHAYTTIVADVLARRHRLLGDDTFFLTGTDEHGQKIERSAAAAGIPPQEFADGISASFESLWKRMGITNDHFIRTTDPRHKQGAQQLFRTLYQRGQIYLSSYTGQYCVSEEMFVEGPPGTIGPDGRPTETVTEENFFFRLSDFQLPLLDLIESGTLIITPDSRRNEVLSFLRGNVEEEISHVRFDETYDKVADSDTVSRDEAARLALERDRIRYSSPSENFTSGTPYVPGALKDLSVSRSSFTWGIPVPEDIQHEAHVKEPHVIYVWLDALANYMTAIGYGSETPEDIAQFEKYWPADLHLVGKEIIRFHCVYWPAFLLALNPKLQHVPGEPTPTLSPEDHREWAAQWLPKAVTAHGWLLFDNSKMSKSKGNIVRTETVLDAFGQHVYAKQFPDSTRAEQDLFATDVLRYFLLREIPFGQDGSFSFDAMWERYNADLTNGYGNLARRVLSMVEQSCDGIIPVHSLWSDVTIQIVDRIKLGGSVGLPDPSTFYMIPDTELSRTAKVCEVFYEKAFPQLKFSHGEKTEDVRSVLSHEQKIERDSIYVIEACLLLAQQTDGYISKYQPWKLAKSQSPEDRLMSAEVLYCSAESIRILTALLYPILPYTTAKVWAQLGLGDIEQAAATGELTSLQWGGLEPGTRLGALSPIFPRADKGLAQIMADIEASNIPGAPADLTGITADNDAVTSERTEFVQTPLADVGGDTPLSPDAYDPPYAAPPGGPPAPSRFSGETTNHARQESPSSTAPDAGPRSLDEPNPIAQVAGAAAPMPDLPRTPGHDQAPASGAFATQASTTSINSTPENASPQITVDDFAKVELRVAQILVAERIPKADKLLRLEVDLGYERRQILSGIAEWYTPEELIGRRIVVITNLAPRKMRGLESHGMLLAASAGDNGKPVLATMAEDIALGSRLK